MGERPPAAKNLLQKVLGSPKTLKNIDKSCLLLKVLGILKGLFQKSLKRVQGRALADKPKFESSPSPKSTLYII
jgi:hypothetical protein